MVVAEVVTKHIKAKKINFDSGFANLKSLKISLVNLGRGFFVPIENLLMPLELASVFGVVTV